MARTRKLDAVEIRVLGALLEKQQTTPQQYPLTTNQVISACNQKTGREPVTDYSETEVTEALDRLRADVLVWRSQAARAERWEHRLDRRWELNPARKAVMTLLLLRGPQTPGELRTRSERMHAFDSVEEVEEVLGELATGFDALVCELPRQPGQRENRWMHLEHADHDPRQTTTVTETAEDEGEPEPPPAAAPPPRRTHDAERLDRLEARVEELARELHELRAALGAD